MTVVVDVVVGVVCNADDLLDAVVLHVDPVAKCVQLTFHKEVVKSVQNLHDNKFTQVK